MTKETNSISQPLTRDNVRARIFAADNTRGEAEIINFFGTKIELRQPSVGDMQKFSEQAGQGDTTQFTQILVSYSYVPGTNEKVFESGDVASLNLLPFNAEMQHVVTVIERFTNLSVQEAEKN